MLAGRSFFISRHRNHKWIGGIPMNHYRRRALKHYGRKCEICGYDKFVEVLQVHHIDRNKNNHDIENLTVLCANCHKEVHVLGLRSRRNIVPWKGTNAGNPITGMKPIKNMPTTQRGIQPAPGKSTAGLGKLG
jgi:hypothetical protein